jgi:2,3-bisphosphoglycerate-independent phosphoglycerate mutase
MENSRPRPTVLIIIDGFGIAPDEDGNAVTRANMPNFKKYTQRYPVVTLKASGETVGLMWGEMGNSEVGHLTIGAGRVYYQALPRIEQAIEDKSFFENEILLKAMAHVKENKGTLHVMGILSSGKVHGYDKHIYSILEMAKKNRCSNVVVHAILDGRDTLYNSGIDFIDELQTKMRKIGTGQLATVSGRFYAMDRDNRWDRTESAYRAIVEGKSESMTQDAKEAIKASYAQEIFDEEFKPTVCTDHKGNPIATVKDGDAIVFTNFRADRARQITKALALPDFQDFTRPWIPNVYIATMTGYEKNLPVNVIFTAQDIPNTLAEVISKAGLVQLHLAETEKYAHITFFLNGAREVAFPNEDRQIVPSPQVAMYNEKPDMSAREITDRTVKAVASGNYDAIMLNFANPDMVAHTGDFEATIKANEVIDECVGKIVDAVLEKDGCVLITADHGNAEEVKNLQTGGVDKEHSTNPVPLFVISRSREGKSGISGDVPNGDLSLLQPVGVLADVAPTMLKVMGVPQPVEMTGAPLIE